MSNIDEKTGSLRGATISRAVQLEGDWIGYQIWGYVFPRTSQDKEQLLMSFRMTAGSQCCEEVGTFMTGSVDKNCTPIQPPNCLRDHDKKTDQFSHQLLNKLPSLVIDKIQWAADVKIDEYETLQVARVNVTFTNAKIVTFWMYNIHNGYYSHDLELFRFGQSVEKSEL